jgi:kynurenine formamidase
MSEKNCAWCGSGGSGICPECAELQIVMQYTGWSRQNAENAIRVWKQRDPNWSAEHIKRCLEYEREVR